MHRQEISMASIKMVIKTSPKTMLERAMPPLGYFISRFKNFVLFSGFIVVWTQLTFQPHKTILSEDWEFLSLHPFYLLFKVPKKCCEGEAKSFCYGRVLMASDAFCQKGWDNLYCWFGMVVNADLINSRLTQTRYSILSGNCRWNTNLQWHGY